MSICGTVSPPVSAAPSALGIERVLTAWIEAVNDYLQRQYRDLVEQEPSAPTLSQYRFECKWLLRSALELNSLVRDPESPVRSFGPELSGKLLQLQELWQSLNDPVSDAEADAVLQRAFPDESRVGSAA